MKGTATIGGGIVATPDPGWQVRGAGDFNEGSTAGIALQNTNTGQVWVWEMNGYSITGGGNVGTALAGWQVAPM
jgi:hypothetical protein